MKCSRFFGGHFAWSFFLASLGKCGQKSLELQKFACSYTYATSCHVFVKLPVGQKQLDHPGLQQ